MVINIEKTLTDVICESFMFLLTIFPEFRHKEKKNSK